MLLRRSSRLAEQRPVPPATGKMHGGEQLYQFFLAAKEKKTLFRPSVQLHYQDPHRWDPMLKSDVLKKNPLSIFDDLSASLILQLLV
jgi:hypothetical protein